MTITKKKFQYVCMYVYVVLPSTRVVSRANFWETRNWSSDPRVFKVWNNWRLRKSDVMVCQPLPAHLCYSYGYSLVLHELT